MVGPAFQFTIKKKTQPVDLLSRPGGYPVGGNYGGDYSISWTSGGLPGQWIDDIDWSNEVVMFLRDWWIVESNDDDIKLMVNDW